MTTNEKGHRADEITAYLSETLEPEEKAAFETHLADCTDCQEELAAQRELFDQVNKALAFKRKRSIDEQVARFEREVAAERAAASGETRMSAKAPVPARRHQRRWALPAAVALAASAAAVFVVLARPGSGVGPGLVAHQTAEDAGAGDRIAAAPHRPGVDAGVDAGGVPAP